MICAALSGYKIPLCFHEHPLIEKNRLQNLQVASKGMNGYDRDMFYLKILSTGSPVYSTQDHCQSC